MLWTLRDFMVPSCVTELMIIGVIEYGVISVPHDDLLPVRGGIN